MKVMDLKPPLSSMGSMAATRMSTRRRPLHTCGVSIVAMARKASKRVRDYNKPIGSMMNRIATLAASTSLFVYIMQFQWLALLSFIDDHILAIEQNVENLFPPSSYVFYKIDEIVHIVEWLPGKLDDAANKFLVIIHQVPFLEWALLCVISWLNFLVSIFTSCGSDSTREKDILIDMNCNDCSNESALSNFPPTPDTPKAETKINEAGNGITKCSYKEILEKGTKTKENIENKDDNTAEKTQKAIVGEEETEERGKEIGNKTNGSVAKDDPILQLFESAWHMKPGR